MFLAYFWIGEAPPRALSRPMLYSAIGASAMGAEGRGAKRIFKSTQMIEKHMLFETLCARR